MGVKARIVLYAPAESSADEAAAAAFDRIGQLDACMSDYRRDSELNRLSDHAGSGSVEVSDDLFDVLQASLGMSRASDGAFDVSVGPLVSLWRKARSEQALPDPHAITAARQLVGWRNIMLDQSHRSVALLKPGMRLDLGGIGKGFAAHRAVDLLKSRGVNCCMVALAGDIAVGDSPPHASGWIIEIDSPARPACLLLNNAAVSTSGDSEQFTEVAGIRYSHIIDPRTGTGVTNHRQVTVVASRGELADGLSSAACIVDADQLDPLIRTFPGTAAIIQDATSTSKGGNRIIDPAHRLHWSRQGVSP